jgi:hypothetical protein
MKKIKIKLKHFYGEYSREEEYYEKYWSLKVLKDNFNVEFVNNEKEADVIFEHCTRISDYKFLKERNKKIVLFSSEDLFKKRDVFNLIESFFHKLGFGEKKWKIMDKIDDIIPHFISSIQIRYFLPRHLEFIKKIAQGKIKNAYAIVQNDIKGKNVLIIPSFLQVFYYKTSKLIKKKEKHPEKRKKFCAFIVSSNSSRERVKFFKMLSKYKKVDSYGKIRNNMGSQFFNMPWRETHNKIYKDYKFVICFENNFAKRYICEKLPLVMLSGTIPLFRGASDIGDYFNTKSFINYDDYGSYGKMVKKIIELDKNDEKYNEFLKEPWFKDNKIPKIFKDKEKELINFYKYVFKEWL